MPMLLALLVLNPIRDELKETALMGRAPLERFPNRSKMADS